MEERENVEILFLGTITRQDLTQTQTIEKSSCQDEIKFNDPVQIELVRIPSNGKQLYSRFISQTQKEQIKSLEIYYRSLDKKLARFSPLASSGNQLLMSSSIDILVTLKEPILTDLLVIRGNFTNISLCIYGRVLRSKQEIEKRCPFFLNNIEVPLQEEQTSIKIHRNIFDESRSMVKAIEDEYTEEGEEQRKINNWDGFSNDRELYDQQITNICKISQQLLVFEDLSHIDQRSIAQIRKNLQIMQSHLSKLFKSSRIGLYYPTPYRPSSITGAIPVAIVKIANKLLSENLSDQFRSLEVLKLILQLRPHAQEFVKLGGVEALISLFLKFFSSDLVILSSLKLLAIQVLIVLSFWEFSANKFVNKIPVSFEDPQRKSSSPRDSSQKQNMESPQKSKSKSRSRDKRKKKSQVSPSKSSQKDRKKSKKQKKDKKNRDKDRSRDKQKDRDRKKDKKSVSKQKGRQKGKQKKISEKQKPKRQEKVQAQMKAETDEFNIKNEIADCFSFYEIVLKIMRVQKNSKLQHLMRVFLQQITQTLTKNGDLSNQMAIYTPLLRDTKYMFNQGGQMINSKTLKMFASFQPFLNEQQSKGVDSPYICQSQKIKHSSKYGISSKLFKLIDSALTILQSKSLDQGPLILDEQFITLVSALIQNNKNGVAIGLSNFIDAIKIDSLLGLKKQEAVVAIICQYIHQIFLEDEGMNLIFFLDQIHNSMLKIIGWLKEDRTFSLEIKRKVQYIINSALIYNHFSGTQNNFKNFSQYFTKLINHENFDINKIVEYSKKQFHKSVNPLTFLNLSENFSLGNFYDVMPAQPLLEIDICLKMFLAILKLNKNIWTVFYQFKFVPAFSTLYLRIHSLLKFFLTPSLQRLNAIVDMKIYERLICNYLQVLKHLTNIFLCKWKYESAFNELIQEEDIFDAVQLYQKWVDTYLFLYNALFMKDSLVQEQRTKNKMKEVLANIIELFNVFFKGYELTKNIDRQRNIKYLIRFIYKQHFQSITFRPGILSLLKVLINLSGQNTSQVIISQIYETRYKISKENGDLLLPTNQKSIFENLLRKNMYRCDENLIENLSGLIHELIKKDNAKQKAYEILQAILDQLENHRKQQMEESFEKSLIIEKTILYLNLLSFVKSPMNIRIQNHILRLLKSGSSIIENNEKIELKKLKLRNSCLNFFKTALTYNSQFSVSTYQQFVKTIANLLQIEQISQNSSLRLEHLKGVLTIVQALAYSCSNVTFQSILLYGEYLQKPYRAACQISLDKIFQYFRQNKHKQMNDEKQACLIKAIGATLVYLLCKLTSIDQCEFYSTQCRKNSINILISPQKQFSLQELISFMEGIAPKEFLTTLKNYIDFPLVEKIQILQPNNQKIVQKKTAGYLYSRAVFTMISENDPVGKTRFELIQDKWEGGDTQGELFKVNSSLDYSKIVEEDVLQKNINIKMFLTDNSFWFDYQGIHEHKQANNLFAFKIRKISPLQSKRNMINTNSLIVLKTIPNEIKRIQTFSKQSTYQNKINVSPQVNRNMNTNMPIQNPIPPQPVTNINRQMPAGMPQQQPQINRTHSNSNNRESSPYSKPGLVTPQVKPTYTNMNPSTSYNQPPAYNPTPHHVANQNQPQPRSNIQYTPNVNIPTMPSSTGQRSYNPTIYDQPPVVPPQDPRGQYYPPRQYDPRETGGYPPNYPMQPPVSHPGYPPNTPTVPPGYSNPNIYRAPTMPVHRPQVNPVRPMEDQMAHQALNILMYLKQNPNVPQKEQLKTKVNRLLSTPGVHDRVTRWLQMG